MPKEPLTIANLDNGKVYDQVNRAIIDANRALLNRDKGESAEVTLKVKLTVADEDGCFRKVTSKVQVAPPKPKEKAVLMPVQDHGGEPTVMAEPVLPETDQLSLPGVADITARRAAATS